MSDLLEIYSDLSSFSLANDIVNGIGNDNTINIVSDSDLNLIKNGSLCGYYVYFGIIAFCFFVFYMVYKFYFLRKQLPLIPNEKQVHFSENNIENNTKIDFDEVNNFLEPSNSL